MNKEPLPHYYGLDMEISKKAAQRHQDDYGGMKYAWQQFLLHFFPESSGDHYDEQQVGPFVLVKKMNKQLGRCVVDLYTQEAFERYKHPNRKTT